MSVDACSSMLELAAEAGAHHDRAAGAAIAAEHRSAWAQKPLLREVYRDVYRRVQTLLADVPGPTVELGAGPGTSREFMPKTLSIDIVAVPWLDLVADACRLPLADGSVANLFMVDVLHHLPYPRRFLAETRRVLKRGGRLVIVDMWPSVISYPVLRMGHPEPVTLSLRPLSQCEDEPLFDPRNPWSSDQGMARAIFWKQARRFEVMYPELRVVHRSQFSNVLWPLTGGFGHKNRVPDVAEPVLKCADRILEPLSRFVGFRSLVALERR